MAEYFNILKTFLSENSKGGFFILALLVGFNIYQIEQINVNFSPVVERATTEYAYNVISYSLRDLTTEEQIVEEINKWKNDGWSAQIGGMRTLCSISPDRLTGLMTPETVTKVCRITR